MLKKHGPGGCCCSRPCVPHEYLWGDAFHAKPDDPTPYVTNTDNAWTQHDETYDWTYTTSEVNKPLLIDWTDTGSPAATVAHVAIGFSWRLGQTVRLVFRWQDADNYWCFELQWIDDGGGYFHLVFLLIQREAGTETVLNTQPAPTAGWGLLSGFRAEITYDADRALLTLIDQAVGNRVAAFGWPTCGAGTDLSGKFGVLPVVAGAYSFTVSQLGVRCAQLANVCDWCTGGIVPFPTYQITVASCGTAATWANGTYLVPGTFVNGGSNACVWTLTTGGNTIVFTFQNPSQPFTLRITKADGKWIEWRSDTTPTCTQLEEFTLDYYASSGVSPSSDASACQVTVQAVP